MEIHRNRQLPAPPARHSVALAAAVLAPLLVTGCGPAPTPAADGAQIAPVSLRVALFNIRELNTDKLTSVDGDGVGLDPQARAAAEIVRRIRPDVLVINEIDHDYSAAEAGLDLNARRFNDAYLDQGESPISYEYAFAAPNNTGLLTGIDLNRDGRVATDADRGTREHGEDCFGFGRHPGEFSIAVLSRHPIVASGARTFQKFRWVDLPSHHMPLDYYPSEAVEIFRLSSKSHIDLPLRIGERLLHLFASHPTPQVFDGEEDRNGRRNFDEIKFWIDYLDGSEALYDDDGRRGGYDADKPFVILGDLNAAPGAGSVYDGIPAAALLLEDPRIVDTGELLVSSRTIDLATARSEHPERDTAVFGGGMRIDYVLPSRDLVATGGGVFWPSADEDPEGAALAEAASDHRLVWLDLELGHGPEEER